LIFKKVFFVDTHFVDTYCLRIYVENNFSQYNIGFMELHILGIRHHGVGSARNVLQALKSLRPDLVMIESPPDLEEVLPAAAKAQMKPPVAILGYNLDNPKQAAFYPFAEFSPEWQAIQFALKNKIALRFADLPLAHGFALALQKEKALQEAFERAQEQDSEAAQAEAEESFEDKLPQAYADPIGLLAEIEGYSDSELWWEHRFEQGTNHEAALEHFEAVYMAMEVLREHLPTQERDLLREAYMRDLLRKAQKEGFKKVVFICGAWHAPALGTYAEKKQEKEDSQQLKSLPKAKIGATWIPWTNSRLSMASGYGAGITSPGWYEHQWQHPEDKGIRWLTRVAQLFREKKMDTSTAHVIEAFRLSEALAAMRALSKPGLVEHQEAVQSVLCFGDASLLTLIQEELIVAKRIGKVPAELPKTPLQAEFEATVKSLRLSISESMQEPVLDLRKPTDLQKSIFFHRLLILGIRWAEKSYASGKGTFKEAWRLRWQPETMIELIDQGVWGNTLADAASNFLKHQSSQSRSISQIAGYIHQAIPAELFDTVEHLLQKINEEASVAAEISDLLEASLSLVEITRYGNVRKSDVSSLQKIVEGLLVRACIGLPNACYGLDEASAQGLLEQIRKAEEAVRILENEEIARHWYGTLLLISEKEGVQAVIIGGLCRLLFDAKRISAEEAARHLALVMSVGVEPAHTAAWIEGFLKGSGTILIYDELLWGLLYKWVGELEAQHFMEMLPVLRRTFSRFEPHERKLIGQKAKDSVGGKVATQANINVKVNTEDFDEAAALALMQSGKVLLGL